MAMTLNSEDIAAIVAAVTPAVAATVLATPAYPLATDSSGRVNLVNAPNSTALSAIATANAAAVLATPANKLVTDGSGRVNAFLVGIVTTLLTETTGYLAAGFKKFFNVAAPVSTVASVNQTVALVQRAEPPAMITAQQVRNALALALTGGTTTVADSIDDKLNSLPAALTDITAGISTETAAKILKTPAHLLDTDVNGAVMAGNLDDVDLSGIPIDVAAAVLKTPAHPLVTDADGYVTANATIDVTGLATQDDVNAARDAILGKNGLVPFTYTLTNDSDGLPIEGVRIWVTRNADGTVPLAQGYTDGEGQYSCFLSAGTVYVWLEKVGVSFINPDTEVVS